MKPSIAALLFVGPCHFGPDPSSSQANIDPDKDCRKAVDHTHCFGSVFNLKRNPFHLFGNTLFQPRDCWAPQPKKTKPHRGRVAAWRGQGEHDLLAQTQARIHAYLKAGRLAWAACVGGSRVEGQQWTPIWTRFQVIGMKTSR